MRYYLDTEFIELPNRIALISVGIAAEDGRGLHLVTDDWNLDECEPWHLENVVPSLGDLGNWYNESRLSLAAVREKVTAFVLAAATPPKHEFWGYFSAYDWTIFCHRIFGKMLNLPEGFPRHCNDLKQMMDAMGVKKSEVPKQESGKHNALEDAKWNRCVHDFLRGLNGEG